jgi:hypothetical protein
VFDTIRVVESASKWLDDRGIVFEPDEHRNASSQLCAIHVDGEPVDDVGFL